MAEIVLNKIDPLRKEVKQRTVSMARIVTSNVSTDVAIEVSPEVSTEVATEVSAKTSTKISTSLRRQIFQTHKGKCSFVSPITGQRCGSNFLLEVDHIIPKALGGQGTKENLRLLCKAHNQQAAIKVFGSKKMGKYLEKYL